MSIDIKSTQLISVVLLVLSLFAICQSPGEAHRVQSLPGYGPLNNIISYAGYIPVSDNQRKGNLFYWFFEKLDNTTPVSNTPITLWYVFLCALIMKGKMCL
jgi:hypothetical protein